LTLLFFTSDIHGSEKCWIKFLNAAEFYKADVIIMGGDVTGKVIIPIIQHKDGKYTTSVSGNDYTLNTTEEIEGIMKRIRAGGFYPYVCDDEEVAKLESDKKKVDHLFDLLMVEGLRRWLSMVEERVNKKVKVIVSPGNDDRFIIDDSIKESERVIYPEESVVEIDKNHEMISCCWSNPTPWNSPREAPEDELEKKFEKEFNRVDKYENLICNFHVPPYNSNLDFAPKLDKNLRVKYTMGKPDIIPVGSKALQKLIKKYEPKLGLHGHVHESGGEKKYDKTLCLNPGSEYGEGILKGYLIDLTNDGIKRYWRVDG
jgi:hypothetical protein